MLNLDLIIFSYFYSLQKRKTLKQFLLILEKLKAKKSINKNHIGIEEKEVLLLFKDLEYLQLYSNSVSLEYWHRARDVIQGSIRRGLQFTFPGEYNYPKSFYMIDDPPYFLSYLGSPVWNERTGFSIVGSREPSVLTKQWCDSEIKKIIGKLPFFIVSGGARGIDQIAHMGAVSLGKPTVVVLPSGLLNLYPDSILSMQDMIIKSGGCLLSEFLPSVKMRKHYFQQRNRLISGLSVGTLVLEAKIKSGSLITAQYCIKQNKLLFVLPSHPRDLNNQGGLSLIIDGATPIRDAEDLIIALGTSEESSDLRNSYLVVSSNS